MGMSKNLKVVLSLVFLVFFALAATKLEARAIDYRDLYRGDHARACDKAHPETCKKQQANPYTRGCEKTNRCRNAPVRKE
ncbi:unnamed protein product [Microthlaspi erraticum]|uniref:Rapid alkalinization factor 1 n=1 Tax=Microthlaspi erraticum TaxID=1685480 RepID=A0A6D2IWA0_9BRAS|nr:unnamed protein product [Microthlaspi erraticum]